MAKPYIMSKHELSSIAESVLHALDQACIELHNEQQRIIINADIELTPAARLEAVLRVQKHIDRIRRAMVLEQE